MDPKDLEQGVVVAEDVPELALADQGDDPSIDDAATATADPEVLVEDMVDTTVVMQQSGYGTDVVAIRDVNGNLHCTNFHIHFTGLPSQWGSRGHKVKVFVNGGTEPVDALEMTLPASKPLGQCTFAFGRGKPEARMLRDLDLQDGCNTLRFVYTPPQSSDALSGLSLGIGKKAPAGPGSVGPPSPTIAYYVDAKLYMWEVTDKVVVTDIDGTLTTTDLMGHIKTVRLANYQYAHKGACGFFSSLAEYGFKVYYLTARPITWMNETRAFLANVRQDSMALPEGPICCSTHHTAEKLVRSLFGIEYADRIKTRFLNGLHDVFARAGRDYTRYGRPLIAGFGNSKTDTRAYKNAHIPFRFNINKKSVMTMEVEAAKVSGSPRSRARTLRANSARREKHAGSKRGSGKNRKAKKGAVRKAILSHRNMQHAKASSKRSERSAQRTAQRQRLKLGVWNVLEDTDAFLGHNAYDMSATDLEKCRSTCERMGFGGFAVWNNRAYFRKQSPGRCFEARRRIARAQFHLAPLYESELQDINAKYYDGDALVLTEESQSDVQEQGSELDDTVSESDSDALTDHGGADLPASGGGSGASSPSAADRDAADTAAPGAVGLDSAVDNSDAIAASAATDIADKAESSNSDEQGDPQGPHDALSKIEVEPFHGHEHLVDATAAAAVASERGLKDTSENSRLSTAGVREPTVESDGEAEEEEEAVASAAAAQGPHRTNRPNALSLTTRMFNTVKSLIPQFLNLLASPEMDDVDTALAGFQQLKVSEGESIAKLELLERQQQERRLQAAAATAVAMKRARNNVVKNMAATSNVPASETQSSSDAEIILGNDAESQSEPTVTSDQDGQDGQDSLLNEASMTETETEPATNPADPSLSSPSKPVLGNGADTKPSPGVSASAFINFFTNGLGGNTLNVAAAAKPPAPAEHPSFASFEDPKLHLIMDIMSVQRAR
eukprot:INCI12181.1.p1 GENE.INCI12181.1~~INCI12181.1.p1  ORF type:complete len:954 (+),score=180.05 INCI12181.1:66-2927(+)